MNVSGFWKDIHKLLLTLKERGRLLVSKHNPERKDPVKELANALHPDNVPLKISKVENAGKDALRYTLTPSQGELPPFQAGQYVSFDFEINDISTTRPYSLISSPSSALKKDSPYLQVVIKKTPQGFISNYIHENWKEGFLINAHLPYGEFHINPLIDSKKLCFIAGGSAITPFLSMIKDIQEKKQDYDVTLFYGIRNENEILCKEELEALQNKHTKLIYVVSDQPDYDGEKGFIDAKLIQKYVSGDVSYFLCGPSQMIEFVLKEFSSMNVAKRRIHLESYSSSLNSKDPSYPLKEKQTFQCIVHRGNHIDNIKISSDEPVAVALEKEGIKIHTVCRSGYCGACRIRLIQGKLYVPKQNENRRSAEKELGYYYACSSYPLTNIEIETNIESSL